MHDDVVVFSMNCGDAALGREDLQHLPYIAELHHPALPVGPDVGGEHFDRGMALLNRLGQRAEHALRQLAVQQQMEPVVTVARAGPFALARFNRVLQWLVRWALDEIEQCRRPAVQCRAADLLGRSAQQILVAARKRDRHAAMNMRIDAARYDDLTNGVDGPRGVDGLQASGRANRGDLAGRNADIRGLRAGWQDCGPAGNDQIEHCPLPTEYGYNDSPRARPRGRVLFNFAWVSRAA